MKLPDAETIRELRDLYETADRFAREVTAFRSEVSIPAHNKLRYAGHHLLQSIDDSGTIIADRNLGKAKHHCERAMYEAAEAGILSALDEIAGFRAEYRSVVVGDVVDDYIGKLRQVRKAQDLLVKGRADRTSIVDQVTKYMEAFRRLRDTLEIFDAARDDCNAKKEGLILNHRKFWIRSLQFLLGIAVTAAIAIFRLM